ncbi:MAG TPA: cohesin domain-containing protein [Candidatus Acidoferrales bacterium]|nr:cohesin domain-containing protein [Candidatus Acidoferrales bacterium]
MSQGRTHESKKEWDEALDAYEKALAEDPADIVYQMAEQKCRFQTAQSHIDKGLRIRARGQLGEALLEFQRAYAINPGSAAAEQELRRTKEMIEVERKKAQEAGKESPPEERALTPLERSKKDTNDRLDSILPVPQLKPINADPIRLKMSGQPKLLFETVAKLAGLNVLWDPEYQPQVRTNVPVEFDNSTLDEALDYLAVITKSYWKPLSPNTIFITMDNPNKRRDYEEQVAKVFYLSNVNTAQELQEIVNAVRSVADIQRFFPYNSQNAIIAKGSADQIALAEKILHDLDKPKSEVVVDIIVIEASTVYTRQLTAALASTGLNVPATFNPRTSIQSIVTGTTGGATGATGSTGSTPVTTPVTTGSQIPLSNLNKLSTADWATTVPGAVLQAVLSDANTKVLQSPQVRSVDNVKATLKIGDRVPTATGSFQPGIGGVGINPLVNTQFTYIDTGVNVDLVPRVHDNGDVSIHIELDINAVNGHVSLGGIDQPIIGQRKITHDVRMREGEVSLLGGLTKFQDNKSKTGIPGLGSIPVLGRLFSGESVDRERSELMIALIPHVIRRPEFTEENLRGIAVGNQASVHLSYGRKPSQSAMEKAPEPPKKEDPPASAGLPPATAPATAVVPGSVVPGSILPGATQPATAPPATAPSMPGTTATPDAAKPNSTPPAPAGNTTVHFLPAQTQTTVQGTITVALVIENGNDVASAPMQFQYDPKVVRLTDIGRGDFLSGDGQVPVFTKNIQNDNGTAIINLNRQPGTAGSSGSGVLVTLIFQGVAVGSSTVTIPVFGVRNSQGQIVASGSPSIGITVK